MRNFTGNDWRGITLAASWCGHFADDSDTRDVDALLADAVPAAEAAFGHTERPAMLGLLLASAELNASLVQLLQAHTDLDRDQVLYEAAERIAPRPPVSDEFPPLR